MTKDAKPGLRDRKRSETWARIELAAVELVLDDGLDATTIDAISERADISPRTFFNYFDSKDAAVLGVRPEQADGDVVAEQLAAADDLDPVVAVVRLVTATMGVKASIESGLHLRRLEIMRRHPEIIGSQFAQLNARKARLATYVSQILDQRAPSASNPIESAAEGAIFFALCATAVRSAIEGWAVRTHHQDTDHSDSSAAIDDADLNEVERIEQAAVALVHSTMRRLT